MSIAQLRSLAAANHYEYLLAVTERNLQTDRNGQQRNQQTIAFLMSVIEKHLNNAGV